MISILFRLLLPFLIFYLLLKFLKHLLVLGWKERQSLNKRAWQQTSRGRQPTDQKDQTYIIDICPKCGEVSTKRHICP